VNAIARMGEEEERRREGSMKTRRMRDENDTKMKLPLQKNIVFL
jgi:hypothetical protein